MTDFWDRILNFTATTATHVGQQLMRDFGTVQADEKADGSLVTRSDQWADHEIRTRITSTFPEHGVLSEEGDHLFPDTDWCWVIDPLDATTNFARGIPIWGTCLGYFIKELPCLVMCIYLPCNKRFTGFGMVHRG